MALFVTAIKMVWSAGHWGNQVTQEQAPVQAHSSNKVAQNQSLPGIVPMYLSKIQFFYLSICTYETE